MLQYLSVTDRASAIICNQGGSMQRFVMESIKTYFRMEIANKMQIGKNSLQIELLDGTKFKIYVKKYQGEE